MIRFSAVLVAVAIGVLIGGVATSKLLLVYTAIAVSAAALVALAIGVVLKREELFGVSTQGQGLVPAGAGASVVLSALAGEIHDKVHPSARVAPPPPFPGAAGYGIAAFGNSSADPDPLLRAAAPGEPWASSPVTPGGRASDWGVPGAGEPGYGTMRRPAPGRHTAGAGDEQRPASDSDAQASGTVPRSWTEPSVSVASPGTTEPPDTTDAPATGSGSGSVPPSWFDRHGTHAVGGGDLATSPEGRTQSGATARPWDLPGRDADALLDEAPAGTPTSGSGPAPGSAPASGSGSGWSWSSRDTVASDDDDDDDWPTRYSWLEDDVAEIDEAGQIDEAGEDAAASAAADTDGADTDGADTDADEPRALGEPDESGDSAELDATSEPHAETEAETDAGGEAGSEPPAGEELGAEPGSHLVTVVPGVPRYHQPDCILIRFMPENDLRKVSIPQAEATACTPCTACQPEG